MNVGDKITFFRVLVLDQADPGEAPGCVVSIRIFKDTTNEHWDFTQREAFDPNDPAEHAAGYQRAIHGVVEKMLMEIGVYLPTDETKPSG